MAKTSLHNVTVELTTDEASGIAAVVKKYGTTPCALFFAVSSALLHRYTGQDCCRPGLVRRNSRIFRHLEIDFSGNPSLNEIIEQIRIQTERFTPANRIAWNEITTQEAFEFVFPANFMRESVPVNADPMTASYYKAGLRLTCQQHIDTAFKLTLSGYARIYSQELLSQITGH